MIKMKARIFAMLLAVSVLFAGVGVSSYAQEKDKTVKTEKKIEKTDKKGNKSTEMKSTSKTQVSSKSDMKNDSLKTSTHHKKMRTTKHKSAVKDSTSAHMKAPKKK